MPHDLFTDDSIKNGFKLSASHMWTLIQIFPVMFGDLLKDNKKYKHFTELIEIFRLLQADKFDEEEIINIETKIENYLIEFKVLYLNEKITYKFHVMIHYGRAIRLFGPPKFYSTMRFESKHSYFKSVQDATHNHVNVTKSLSHRHQNMQVYHLSSPYYYPPDLITGTEDKKIEKDNKDVILQWLNKNADEVSFYNWVIKTGIKYHLGDTILISNVNSPIFGLINALIVGNDDSLYFCLTYLKTIKYESHLLGFIIEDTEQRDIISKYENLISIYPIDETKNNRTNNRIIVPKFPLITGITK